MSNSTQWHKQNSSTGQWHCWEEGTNPPDPPMCAKSIPSVTGDVLGAAITLSQCCAECKIANDMPES
jgi:hypothetical protein